MGISMFHTLHCLQMLRMVGRESDVMRSAVYGEGGSMNAYGDRVGEMKEHRQWTRCILDTASGIWLR